MLAAYMSLKCLSHWPYYRLSITCYWYFTKILIALNWPVWDPVTVVIE